MRPDLLLVLDKSGSMANDFTDQQCAGATVCGPTNPSKWTAMTQALTAVLTQTPDLVDWGLELFPSNAVCAVDPGAAIAVGPDNTAAILQAMMLAPNGLTPTAVAEQNAVVYLSGLTDGNPRYILLATDGLPNCAATGTQTADDARAIQAVADAFTAGVRTFVLGIGNVAVAQSTLNAMAMAGGEAQPADAQGRIYFPADGPAALTSALTDITHSIASCRFSLAAPPASPADLVVLGDGSAIARDASNGWSFGADDSVIVLNGAACAAFKSGAIQSLSAVAGCPAYDM
jgi:hypothetical protein